MRRLVCGLAVLWGCSEGAAPAPSAAPQGGSAGSGGQASGAGGQAGGAVSLPPPAPGQPVPEWDRDVAVLPAAEAASKRASCAFQAGALPKETLGDGSIYEGDLPIDHFVIVMLENRSFDHMLQKLPDVGVTDADVAPAEFSNQTTSGKVIPIHPVETYCIADTAHSWGSVHAQLDSGKMSGFVTSNQQNGQDGARAMGYLGPEAAPFSYFLAKTFALSDRHFCSVPGPTWPNRNFFYAASSFGRTRNEFPEGAHEPIHALLSKRGVDWRNYKSDIPGAGAFLGTLLEHKANGRDYRFFAEDMAKGDVASVTFVDPQLFGGRDKTSMHPPANHEHGEAFLHDVVSAVTSSPVWAKTAILITYDEHGGFYDHVPPPSACAPDDIPPQEGAELGGFDRLGVRVPLYVVSPYAKRGHVSHVVTDHTSVLRLLQLRFRIPALSRRDANAEALLDLFDLTSPPDTSPPSLPPRPTLTAAQEAACQTGF